MQWGGWAREVAAAAEAGAAGVPDWRGELVARWQASAAFKDLKKRDPEATIHDLLHVPHIPIARETFTAATKLDVSPCEI